MASRTAEALDLAEEIITMIDEDIPEKAWDKAAEFFESIREKATSISETIEERGEVSDKQISALENMKAGVSKWIRD